MSSNDQIAILGAGAPHHGDSPAIVSELRQGSSVFRWLLEAMAAEQQDITFVAGYQADLIRECYPALPVLENPDWQHSGSAASLLMVPVETERPLLVSYGDILFRAELRHALQRSEAPITVVWDSQWRRRYAGRSAEDLARCEKVAVAGDRVVRLGADLPADWADGEFTGLVRFRPEALERLVALRDTIPESLRRVHLSGLIEYLRAGGLEVAGLDVAGDWAEVNEPRDIAHFVLGTKAETLERLCGMIRNAVIQEQVSFTVSEWRERREPLLQRVRERFGESRLVVRSSARSEDSFTSANAGAYDSLLDVDPRNGLGEAVDRVIASYGEAVAGDQVLVQPMVRNVTMSGVAFTRTLERGAPWIVINYDSDGGTEGITSGASADHRTLLVRRGTEDGPLPVRELKGLVAALAEIEELLGYDALDVEFAVDGEGTIHILQVRPIAVEHQESGVDDALCHAAMEQAHRAWRRLAPSAPHLPGDARPLYGVMPDWNPAEIIGTAPGALAESLYRYLVMDEVWATQRAEYGYRDVRPAPLLAGFAGRPYVDVRASFASFIPASVGDGLAGRLLGFYLDWLAERPELHDKVEFEVVPTCLAPGFERWERRLREAGGFSAAEVAELRQGLHGITAEAFARGERDGEAIRRLADRYRAVRDAAALGPLERARLLLEDCRRFGTLPFAHLARSGFIAVTLLRGAVETGAISAAARDSFLSTVRTVSHELTRDARATAAGEMAWDAFVARYGHLRPGTYDLTSPRYDADPEHFLRPLVEHAAEAALEVADDSRWRSERGAFLEALRGLGLPADAEAVEGFLRQSIEGRESAKFIFSRNLSAALEALAALGERLGLGRSALAEVRLDDILALRDARHPGLDAAKHLRELAEAGRRARRVAGACELPPLLTSERDLDAFVLGADVPNFIGSRGVTAECIELGGRSGETGLDVTGYIALIPQADPGYDWLFGQGIAGLVTLFGGANSHMAIRAAEFGLPAAIGVGEQRYRELTLARVIELAPANGILRVVR